MTATRPLPTEEDLDAIREGVRAVCAPFDDEYWLDRDNTGEFPKDFHRAMADGGWLGITMPEEYGGSGLGVTEAMTMWPGRRSEEHTSELQSLMRISYD